MDNSVKKELEIIINKKKDDVIHTSTIYQLLNDLGKNTDKEYFEAIAFLEDTTISLVVDDDDTGKRRVILDSSKISIFPKTLSVESIVKKLKYQEINLDTEFQRKRSLWNIETKSQLIESFMVQLPVPPMYFDGKESNNWLVIDGLQRLCTLQEFFLQDLKLSGLEYLADYDGFTFQELPRVYQRRIEEAQISFYLILPETPDIVKYSLFKRINTPGLRLEDQEIRHALYQGVANELLSDLAESKDFKKATSGDIPSERMQDQEIVLRYFALKYLGFDAFKDSTMDQYLNNTMSFLNEQDDRFIKENKELFISSLRCIYSVFDKHSFRRISKKNPTNKKPFNSALFEGWMVSVSELTEEQRRQLSINGELLKQLYINELATNTTFYQDIGSGKYRSLIRRVETIKELIREALNNDK